VIGTIGSSASRPGGEQRRPTRSCRPCSGRRPRRGMSTSLEQVPSTSVSVTIIEQSVIATSRASSASRRVGLSPTMVAPRERGRTQPASRSRGCCRAARRRGAGGPFGARSRRSVGPLDASLHVLVPRPLLTLEDQADVRVALGGPGPGRRRSRPATPGCHRVPSAWPAWRRPGRITPSDVAAGPTRVGVEGPTRPARASVSCPGCETAPAAMDPGVREKAGVAGAACRSPPTSTNGFSRSTFVGMVETRRADRAPRRSTPRGPSNAASPLGPGSFVAHDRRDPAPSFAGPNPRRRRSARGCRRRRGPRPCSIAA